MKVITRRWFLQTQRVVFRDFQPFLPRPLNPVFVIVMLFTVYNCICGISSQILRSTTASRKRSCQILRSTTASRKQSWSLSSSEDHDRRVRRNFPSLSNPSNVDKTSQSTWNTDSTEVGDRGPRAKSPVVTESTDNIFSVIQEPEILLRLSYLKIFSFWRWKVLYIWIGIFS